VTVCVDVTVSVDGVVVVSVVCASLLAALTARASAPPATRASISRTADCRPDGIIATGWNAPRSRRMNGNVVPTDPLRITHFG
jgi:hypothetical protein